ncbi:MAG: FAD-dependent oxidoreductase, partial [Novosphingobium sp.]|nr:FAD-dependent oxidoreductase [Novosphingobium sp.]
LPHVLGGDDLRRLVMGEDMDSLRDKMGLATRIAAKAGAMTCLTRDPGFIREASKSWLPLGKRIVVVGGDLVGLELAEFLAERGREVTVVDENAQFGRGLTIVRRWRVFDELQNLGVALRPGHMDIAIEADNVSARDPQGAAVRMPADHVIVAKGARGELGLAHSLERAGFAVHAIGDCTGIGYIEGAIRSAAQAARAI